MPAVMLLLLLPVWGWWRCPERVCVAEGKVMDEGVEVVVVILIEVGK